MNDLEKLTQHGRCVVVFPNSLGTFTAFTVHAEHEDIAQAAEDADEDGTLTDDFSAEAAINRLADKVLM